MMNADEKANRVFPTLKPLNEKAVKAFAEGKKGVVVCEEASIRGGLNMLVSYILRGTAVPIESVAVMDEFGQSASSHEELLEYYGLEDVYKRQGCSGVTSVPVIRPPPISTFW